LFSIISKKKLFIVLLVSIFLVGAFLRAYNFSDWLHFELDQSRDAKIIDLAIEEGIGNLPLLGPKAAGSFLRLGPIFYYFKYISALIFGNTPSGMSVIIMIFGILAIPAFYIFIKRYFEKWTTLSLTLLFSLSLFLIMYSRFSWNPNALPLFIILSFYCLLRAVEKEEKRRGLYLLGLSLFLTITTQLHFLAFVSIPVVVLIFLVIKRPKIKMVYWLGAIFIFFFFNSPIIINEIKTGGKNSAEFLKVSTGKSNKNDDRTFLEKIIRNYTENSVSHFLILSSKNASIPKFYQKPNFNIQCDLGCRNQLNYGIISFIIFSVGLFLLFFNLLIEKNRIKKDFLILSTVWTIVVFALFTPLAFDISPRFWLIISALPFIFFGFILESLKKFIPRKIALILFVLLVFVFFYSNIRETYRRFDELKNAPTVSFKVSGDRILREKARVTLEQQYMIVEYIKDLYSLNKFPVYLNSDPQYRRSLLFHLDKLKIPREDFRNTIIDKKIYQNGNYLLIYPTLSNWQSDLDKYADGYELLDKKEFGTLTVFRLTPKSEVITHIQQEFKPREKAQRDPNVPERYTWKEVFSRDNLETSEDENEEIIEEEESE
jgi:hypothetical protein